MVKTLLHRVYVTRAVVDLRYTNCFHNSTPTSCMLNSRINWVWELTRPEKQYEMNTKEIIYILLLVSRSVKSSKIAVKSFQRKVFSPVIRRSIDTIEDQAFLFALYKLILIQAYKFFISVFCILTPCQRQGIDKGVCYSAYGNAGKK